MALALTDNSQAKLESFQRLGRNVHSYFRQIRLAIAANEAVDTNFLLSALQAGRAFAAVIAAADSDIVVAYRRETGQTGAQVQAEAATTANALSAVNAAIVAAYPKDAERRLLDRVMDVNGDITSVTIPASSLGAVGTAIDAWIAAVR